MTLRNALVAGVVGAGSLAAPAALGPVATDTPTAQQVFADAAASAPCHVDPRDLYGIQQVESGSAVLQPDGTATNPDGSLIVGDGGSSHGPFQFNEPAGTWERYGSGDVNNLADSAAATARMLCAHGYSSDRRAAIKAHNGSGPAADAYAAKVLAVADSTSSDSFKGGAPGRTGGGLTFPPSVPQADRYRGAAGRFVDVLFGSLADGIYHLTSRRPKDPKAASIYQQVNAKTAQIVAPLPAVASPSAPTTTTEPFPVRFPTTTTPVP